MCNVSVGLEVHPAFQRLLTSHHTKRLHGSCGVLDIDIAAVDDKLREVSNRYPAATARIYERILWSFTRCFLGIVPGQRLSATSVGGTGIFGPCTAFFGVTETQGRGSLHFHVLVWGGPSTEVMSQVCDDADLIRRFAVLFEEIVTAEVPVEILELVKNQPAMRYSQLESPVDYEGILARGREVAAARNNHLQHKPTCCKGSVGKRKCRFCFPQAPRIAFGPHMIERDAAGRVHEVPIRPRYEPPSFCGSDDRVIVFELRRPDGCTSMTPFNPALSAATGANTAVVPLFNREAAESAMHYILPYVTKDVVAPANILSLVSVGLAHAKKYESRSETRSPQRNDAVFVLNKLLNTLSSIMEVSVQNAAFALLGHEPWETSATFWYLFPSAACKYAREVYGAPAIAQPRNDDEHSEPEDNFLHDNEPDLDGGVDDELLRDPVNDDVDFVDIEVEDAGVTFAMPQHLAFARRGAHLMHFSLYEYAMLVDIVKAHAVKRGGKVGRAPNPTFAFEPEHPTLVQRLRSKLCVPQIIGKIPLFPGPDSGSQSWQRQAAVWAEWAGVVFLPWSETVPPLRTFVEVIATVERYRASGEYTLKSIASTMENVFRRKKPMDVRQMLAEFRGRCTPLWSERNPPPIQSAIE